MKVSRILDDESETVHAGHCLGESISCGAVVFLEGTLGAGKTTFCRGVMNAFGHSGAVKSPTYTLVEPYSFGGVQLYHFDLYRLSDPEELEYMGGRDYFQGDAICLVEWPERGKGFVPEVDIQVNLDPEGSGRQLRLTAKSPRGVEILTAWQEKSDV